MARRPRLSALWWATVLAAGCGVGAPEHAVNDTTPVVVSDPQRVTRQIALRLRIVTCDSLTNGSGFLLDADTAVTNAHVVDNWSRAEISSWNGHATTITRVWTHTNSDLAVVELDEPFPEGSTRPVADITRPAVGDDVFVPGYPGGGEFVLQRGELLRILDGTAIGERADVYEIDATVEPGSSGGAVVTGDGSLVGVVFGFDPQNGHALAIDPTLLDTVDVGRQPWVGLPATSCD